MLFGLFAGFGNIVPQLADWMIVALVAFTFNESYDEFLFTQRIKSARGIRR
jgi:hypothetical protein